MPITNGVKNGLNNLVSTRYWLGQTGIADIFGKAANVLRGFSMLSEGLEGPVTEQFQEEVTAKVDFLQFATTDDWIEAGTEVAVTAAPEMIVVVVAGPPQTGTSIVSSAAKEANVITIGKYRLIYSPTTVSSGGLASFRLEAIEASQVNEPLRLTFQPTTKTLGQIRRMRQPNKWQAAEQYVRELYGSTGERHFSVTGTGGRYVDSPVNLPTGGVWAGEVKAYGQWRIVSGVSQRQTVSLSDHLRQQIQKDVWLRNNVSGYDPRWIFIDAPPSQELLDLLSNHGIVSITY